MSFRRFDRATFTRATRLDNGMLRAPARLARTGVLEYRLPDGTISRELRLPEEVFSEDSVASFELVPLTDDHPSENGGEVTAENAKRLSVGSVGTPHQDGRYLAATLMVVDSNAISKIDEGKQELSCGYFCDREPAPAGAVWQDSETGQSIPYNFIQRNIRGNHVALVEKGRAGPSVRVQLDSTDGVQVDAAETQEPQKMKFTVDGIEYAEPEVMAAAFAKHVKEAAEKATAAKSELDKQAARADIAEASVAALTKDLADAKDPAKLYVAVAARVALETKARQFIGDAKLDGLDEAGVKRAVVVKLSPDMKLDGKSADYVDALFDHLTANAPKTNPTAERIEAEKVANPPAVQTDGLTPRERFERAFFAQK